jgi:hypothetical protein
MECLTVLEICVLEIKRNIPIHVVYQFCMYFRNFGWKQKGARFQYGGGLQCWGSDIASGEVYRREWS